MALYYNLTFRGTLLTENWAVTTHWRAELVGGAPTEAQICEKLCNMGYAFWDNGGKNAVSGYVNLTKLVATAYKEPTGFFEQPAAIGGYWVAEPCPAFVAKGFRQLRTNQDFRSSTHRFPEVLEQNNQNGNWLFSNDITQARITAISEFLGQPHTVQGVDVLDSIVFTPVLIRTQYTTKLPGGGKSVTILDPHQISDVAEASFYGITSQVSRKYIIPR